MGRLKSSFVGKLIAFDTAPLIYYVEEHSLYFSLTEELFGTIRERQAQGLTSALTLTEVLAKPFRMGRSDLAYAYRGILSATRGVSLCPAGEAVCEQAARLRADYGWLRTPDALQIATALVFGADAIVTNDDRWKRLATIPVFVLKDYL
ncbi:MAG TPA: type II toxin-antitoxin system VapC family toxin [Terriglobia bacterium]|nr:type II toxin-antitoxin system VapC family toxin [Terriglobia bacterium]